ncbi:hypothetical protein J3F83DRAFT_721429 [Trichoderma novae-zelandiae]
MAYLLTTSYAGESLLSGFNWFNGVDPSHGFVSYQSRRDAESMGLYSIDEGSGVVRLGVDSTHEYSPSDRGRPSIRIESKETYDHGLFIADFLHMPPSQCGLWPAFWTYGDDWPHDGEVDIVEGVNTAHKNILSAHTADGCTQSPTIDGLYSGDLINTECAVGTDNIGCGFHPPEEDASSYGDGFNAAHGGVYAMEWDPVHIRIWHFARGSIPRDIEDKRPDPEAWGLPVAVFGGESCDVDRYFKRMRLVLNINFCGDYGNAVWGRTDQCDSFAATCPEYVAAHPEAFANAYWDVRYIDAYQLRAGVHSPRPDLPSRPDLPDLPGRPGRPGRPDPWDERTTTTTMTAHWTETVTAYATGHHPHGPQDGDGNGDRRGPVPAHTTAAIEPVATKAPVNPVRISNYSYLGCFYSSTDFTTFTEVADARGMTLGRCIELCRPRTYAGVFDSHCFCADELDAGTRATKREGLCDRECPGNGRELCGGLVGPRDDDGPREKFAADETPRHALTVYGFVAEEEPEQPPAMAPGSNGTWRTEGEGTVTAVAEVTVFPVSEDDSRWRGGEYWGGGRDGEHDDGDHQGDWHDDDEQHDQDDRQDDKQDHGHDGDEPGDGLDCDQQAPDEDEPKEDGHDWNKQWGDEHQPDHHDGDWEASAPSSPSADAHRVEEEQGKPATTEVVVSVTETVVDCPEGVPTEEALVIPTWLPPVEPKPWVPSDPPFPLPPPPQQDDHDHLHHDAPPPPHDGEPHPQHDPPPPPSPPPPSHDDGHDRPHDPPHTPHAHNDTTNHSHPPFPSPTSPDSPVNSPFVLVAAAASTTYGGLQRYLAIIGSSILLGLAMGVL